MPLGWESNTKYAVDLENLGGKSKLGVRNPRAPHPLYETLIGYDSNTLLTKRKSSMQTEQQYVHGHEEIIQTMSEH